MNCTEKTAGPGDCERTTLQRLRYFTGRHMTARDFCDADAYHRSMRHLHNRVLHGWGVACGLDVRLHTRPECGVIVKCGMAIDCCGREIVVPRTATQHIPWDEWPVTAAGARDPDYVLLLCLEYCEVLTEKVPVLYSSNACSSAHYEEGRIQESYKLHWHAVKRADLEALGWHTGQGCPPDDAGHCNDEDTLDCCLDPRCPPDACVPLAVICGDEAQPEVHTDGRHSIAQSREHLTHICWISWPHGGFMKLSDFTQLSVRFDRELAKPHHQHHVPDGMPGPVGINERTFVAQYGAQREDLDFVMFHKPPHLHHDRRTAVFDITNPGQYVNQTIHVTLRCDFILDCRGNPVDGNHLRGRLPSGDGVVGGTFESWFQVIRDDDYERLTQAANLSGVQP